MAPDLQSPDTPSPAPHQEPQWQLAVRSRIGEIVRNAAAAIAIPFYVAAALSTDFWAVGGFALAGIVVGLLAVWTSDLKWRIAAAAALVFFGVLAGSIGAWHVERLGVENSSLEPALAAASEFELLKYLDEHFAQKDVASILNEFDVPGMLEENIADNQCKLLPVGPTRQALQAQTDAYFNDGRWIVRIRPGLPAVLENGFGHMVLYNGPERIVLIRSSKKYNDNINALTQLSRSGKIPADVRDALNNLKQLIEKNNSTMIDVLDAIWVGNKDAFLYDHNPSTPYAGGVENTYYSHSRSLEPALALLRQRVTKHLTVIEGGGHAPLFS